MSSCNWRYAGKRRSNHPIGQMTFPIRPPAKSEVMMWSVCNVKPYRSFLDFPDRQTGDDVRKRIMTQSLLACRLCLILAAFLIAALRPSCVAGSLQLVTGINSEQTPPAGGGGDSYAPIISRDGRFVLFASTANNLITISNNAFAQTAELSPLNVYLRDRVKGTT